jgi:hypothetical protein
VCCFFLCVNSKVATITGQSFNIEFYLKKHLKIILIWNYWTVWKEIYQKCSWGAPSQIVNWKFNMVAIERQILM